MSDVLLDRPGWYVIGAMLGLIVVGVLATINRQLGALGGYSAVVERVSGRSPTLGWKAWFLLGILGGSLVFRLLAGSSTVGDGYGWLTRTFTGAWELMVGVLLLVAGVLIGFGAKTAGGCTSGNGICGTALGSPASFAATGTFMATAVAATLLIEAVI
jgi:uncharacterized membrane protein YedE/YeeE